MPDVMEKVSNLEQMMLERLAEHGFKRKRQNVFSRKESDCKQHVSMLVTKTRGEDMAHVTLSVGFTYEAVNKTIYTLQNKKYDSRWASASVNIGTLMNKEPYGIYITEKTEMSDVADKFAGDIEKYALNLWESCNSLSKYHRLLHEKDELVRNCTYALNRPEWNLLALSVLAKQADYEAILDEYQDDFNKRGYSISDIRERTEELLKER